MKDFNAFIEEAATKRCPTGKYYCNDDKCCKIIPKGWHVMRGGYLAKDGEDEDGQTGNSHSNNGSNGNGGNGNGSNGGGNGG